MNRPSLSVSAASVVLLAAATGATFLWAARGRDVEVPVAARDIQPFEALEPTDTLVVDRPTSEAQDPMPPPDANPVVTIPIPSGQPIGSPSEQFEASPARRDDLIVVVGLAADAPARALLRPGLDVDLLLSRPPTATQGDGAVIEGARVLTIGSDAITLSIPDSGRAAIADVGIANVTIGVVAG